MSTAFILLLASVCSHSLNRKSPLTFAAETTKLGRKKNDKEREMAVSVNVRFRVSTIEKEARHNSVASFLFLNNCYPKTDNVCCTSKIYVSLSLLHEKNIPELSFPFFCSKKKVVRSL